MKIAFLASGTRGDAQPVIAIGDALSRRGHSVVVAVNSDLAPWIRRAGLEAVPMAFDVAGDLKSEEAQRLLATGRLSTLVKRIARDERAANESIVKASTEISRGADLFLSTLTMSMRGLCIADATGVPAGNLLYFPVQRTREWSSMLAGGRDFRLASMNRASFTPLYRLLWSQSRSNIDDMCDALEIPRYERRPRFEDLPSLHLYSRHLAPRPADWGAQHRVVGATSLSQTLRQQLGESALPADLQAWLGSGTRPVFFGFGSMPVLDPDRVLRDVASVTAERGLRALVGAGWSDYQLPSYGLPDHVFLATESVNHDLVLPRCIAAVHHGGSGTTAAVLRAGIPSLVASVFADQPFWGRRLQQNGTGVTLPFRRLTAERLAGALDRLLGDGYASVARAVGELVRREDGTRAAADLIERWAETASAPREPVAEGRAV